MTRIASAGQQPSREGSADWETGASPNGPTPRTLATLSRFPSLRFDDRLAGYVRANFAKGYGARWIAFHALRDGITSGVSLEALVQRITKWRRVMGIPKLRQRRAVRGQPIVIPDAVSEAQRRARFQKAKEEASRQEAETVARLRRPDTPCAWCDCTRPGRACIECGRVAPDPIWRMA